MSGEVFHEGRPKPYGDSYRSGDVIGCLISLGETFPPPNWPIGSKKRDRVLIKLRGNIYYEAKEYAQFPPEKVKESQERGKPKGKASGLK
jgi:COMPASS component BRE2